MHIEQDVHGNYTIFSSPLYQTKKTISNKISNKEKNVV